MAIFKGIKGRDDTFTGGGKADRFEFDPLDLNGNDTITGGSGRAIDVLRFMTPGAIGLNALGGVSQIERIELANGGANSLILSDALVASATGARVQVLGGDGDDFVYAAGLNAGSAMDFVSSGGNDYVFGGDGEDTFSFDVATLDAADRIFGGAGANTLILSGSGTVSAAQMLGMQGIGMIRLGDSGVSIAITDTAIAATNDGVLSVAGGAGEDIIDAGSLIGGAQQLVFSGGAGDDVITATGSAVLAALDGGTGADTISAGSASVVYDGADVSVAVGQGVLMLRGAATIDLTQTANRRPVAGRCQYRNWVQRSVGIRIRHRCRDDRRALPSSDRRCRA